MSTWNLNRSIESFSYRKVVPRDNKEYEDLSLAEFLNEEIKNIKRYNTLRNNDIITLYPKENKINISMIKTSYRPSTPNPNVSLTKARIA